VSAAGLKKWQGLEVGCGTGENALYLAGNGFSVTGVDLTSRAIIAAKAKSVERKLKVDFRIGKTSKTGFSTMLLIRDCSTHFPMTTGQFTRGRSPGS